MYEKDQIIQGTVSTLAYGGKGILRTQDQMVVFVPFTSPGDEITCRLTKVKKNYAEADLVEVLVPSLTRVTPKCPYFGTCGGCQLQHLSYDTQAEYKRLSVKDALSRVFPDVSVSIHKANPLWHYRTHVTLTLRAKETGYQAGFFSINNISLVEVKQCPIFCNSDDPILKILGSLAAELVPADPHEGKVKILKDLNQNHILSFHFKTMPKNFASIAKKYLKGALIGISGTSMRENMVFGKTEMEFIIDGKRFKTSPSAFLQAHQEQAQELYREIAMHFKQFPAKFLIDLYCGIGVTSIFAAPYAKRIEGVEMNRKAVELAKLNAKDAKISCATFTAAKVEEKLQSLLELRPDAAIVNPPREGLQSGVPEALAKSSLKTILYISCQPATLARDLNILKNGGFVIEKAQAFDMFPQTGHIETLVSLTRS